MRACVRSLKSAPCTLRFESRSHAHSNAPRCVEWTAHAHAHSNALAHAHSTQNALPHAHTHSDWQTLRVRLRWVVPSIVHDLCSKTSIRRISRVISRVARLTLSSTRPLRSRLRRAGLDERGWRLILVHGGGGSGGGDSSRLILVPD
eukprot:6207819-Pleurochrysis_carterae.AAC.1